MGKGKHNSPRNLTPEIDAPTPPSGSSHRPRSIVRRLIKKAKDGAYKLKPRSKDSRSNSPAPPNYVHDDDEERASSTPNIEDAQQAGERMLPLSGPAMIAVSVGQDVQAGLNTADTFQDTYLKPLRIFDDVIGKIADVWSLLSVGTELT
ncbi:hypothetical protein BDR07DRAFT_1382573 [Suillus spraguei]|nr:hypothetical protein BDR07DRAFT_1382573 [Suillus spraguei]